MVCESPYHEEYRCVTELWSPIVGAGKKEAANWISQRKGKRRREACANEPVTASAQSMDGHVTLQWQLGA